jgi:hypothetical protein
MTKTFQRTARPTGSPWGGIHDAKEYAPGIWRVSTASHGGFIISDEREAAIPAHLKSGAENGDYGYEEDCGWALVVIAFREELKDHRMPSYPEGQTTLGYAIETLRGWYPKAYAIEFPANS